MGRAMSAESWKISVAAPRETVEAVLEAQPEDEIDIVLSGREIDEARGEWMLEAWLEEEPSPAQIDALKALFPPPSPELTVERLEEQDWVTLSQAGMEPIRTGRFHVRTPDHPAPDEAGLIDLVIPASQAFGTGQHATTAGCLAMLDQMAERGENPARIVDVGTGTGLLAFSATRLWPDALVTASDIDPVCETVLRDNARLNGISLGDGAGEIAPAVAPGVDHPLLRARAPYDLLIANILAGPLIDLAPEFAPHIAPGGSVLLAGLLTSQEAAVLDAYDGIGIELVERMVSSDWSILWLRKTAQTAGG